MTAPPERWPLDDRPLNRPAASRLSPTHPRHSEILAAHESALHQGQSMYPDAETGLFVLTASFLADRGFCCERGCRHCPYVSG